MYCLHIKNFSAKFKQAVLDSRPPACETDMFGTGPTILYIYFKHPELFCFVEIGLGLIYGSHKQQVSVLLVFIAQRPTIWLIYRLSLIVAANALKAGLL